MASKKSRKNSSRQAVSSSGSNRYLAWYLLVPLVLLLSIAAPWKRLVMSFFAPYLSINKSAVKAFSDQTLKLHSRKVLAGEITRLRRQNLELSMQVRQLQPLQNENIRLRKILELKSPPGYDYIACDVVLRDPWMWNSGFTIDRGSNDGLQPGWSVLAPAADEQGNVVLLGVIESVSKHSSRVISVLNPEFRISVLLPESGVVGFLNPNQYDQASGGTACIGLLPANRTFALNEQIFTTGYEAAIPRGLLLGSLESMEQTALPFGNRLYRQGIMRPANDLETLRSVVVARVKKLEQPEKSDNE